MAVVNAHRPVKLNDADLDTAVAAGKLMEVMCDEEQIPE